MVFIPARFYSEKRPEKSNLLPHHIRQPEDTKLTHNKDIEERQTNFPNLTVLDIFYIWKLNGIIFYYLLPFHPQYAIEKKNTNADSCLKSGLVRISWQWQNIQNTLFEKSQQFVPNSYQLTLISYQYNY